MISWGSTPPNCAVNGLVSLLRRNEWRGHPDGERIRELLHPQLDSEDETVRMLASMALPLLVEPDHLTEDLCRRLLREESPAVIEVLIGLLADQVTVDPHGIDACLARLAATSRRSVLAGLPEDGSTPPNKRPERLGDVLIRLLLHLAIVRPTPFASQLFATWQSHPENYPATIGRLVSWARPYLNPPQASGGAVQTRVFEVLDDLTSTCARISTTTQESLTSRKLSDQEAQDGE